MLRKFAFPIIHGDPLQAGARETEETGKIFAWQAGRFSTANFHSYCTDAVVCRYEILTNRRARFN